MCVPSRGEHAVEERQTPLNYENYEGHFYLPRKGWRGGDSCEWRNRIAYCGRPEPFLPKYMGPSQLPPVRRQGHRLHCILVYSGTERTQIKGPERTLWRPRISGLPSTVQLGNKVVRKSSYEHTKLAQWIQHVLRGKIEETRKHLSLQSLTLSLPDVLSLIQWLRPKFFSDSTVVNSTPTIRTTDKHIYFCRDSCFINSKKAYFSN